MSWKHGSKVLVPFGGAFFIFFYLLHRCLIQVSPQWHQRTSIRLSQDVCIWAISNQVSPNGSLIISVLLLVWHCEIPQTHTFLFIQTGNRHSSAQQCSSLSKRPPTRFNNGPQRQEPPGVTVQLQGRPHHGRNSWSLWSSSATEVLAVMCLSVSLLTCCLWIPQALLASSYVPLYAGLNPVNFKGQVIIDTLIV